MNQNVIIEDAAKATEYAQAEYRKETAKEKTKNTIQTPAVM